MVHETVSGNDPVHDDSKMTLVVEDNSAILDGVPYSKEKDDATSLESDKGMNCCTDSNCHMEEESKTSDKTVDNDKTNTNRITNADVAFQYSLDSSSLGERLHNVRLMLERFIQSRDFPNTQLGRNRPNSDPEKYAIHVFSHRKNSLEQLSECESSASLPVVVTVEGEDTASTSGKRRCSSASAFSTRSQENVFVEDSQTAQDYSDESNVCNGTVDDVYPDEKLLRELLEMRVLLERLLENREMGAEWHNDDEFVLDIPRFGNLSAITKPEPVPHFPVGMWKFVACEICFEFQGGLYLRPCCEFPACNNCLQQYYTTKIQQGIIKIQCCNQNCKSYVHRDEISARLSPEMKETFYKLLVIRNVDERTKTCPRCNHVLVLDSIHGLRKKQCSGKGLRVECPECSLQWCFSCHAPWHDQLTCKQFRRGDRLLRSWAREMIHGQLNAQKCPKCKIFIQRTSGCDHMHCTRCKTDFCYRCGERFRRLKFFGDHYSKLSVFGCKYRYKADKPLQRKTIRGAVCGLKVVAAPLLGSLAVCAGALAVALGLLALPVYGGVRLYRHYESNKRLYESNKHLMKVHTLSNRSLALDDGSLEEYIGMTGRVMKQLPHQLTAADLTKALDPHEFDDSLAQNQ